MKTYAYINTTDDTEHSVRLGGWARHALSCLLRPPFWTWITVTLTVKYCVAQNRAQQAVSGLFRDNSYYAYHSYPNNTLSLSKSINKSIN